MKAFISLDLEGLPHVVSKEQLGTDGKLYSEAREIATELTLSTIDALMDNGVDDVLIADSHGEMLNIMPERLPDNTELIRGYPRALCMVCCVEECDMALFLGYHAKGGTISATLDHAFSGSRIDRIDVNGIETSEFLLNGYVAGKHDVPVIFVAGDSALIEEVSEAYPKIQVLSLKKSLSRYAARSYGMETIKNELTRGVEKAVEKFRAGEIDTIITDEPAAFRVRFTRTDYADCAALLPGSKRIDGKTVEYESIDIIEGYKTLELLTFAISGL